MSNVGFATLQVLPSLKNLHRNLTKEASPVLTKWAKDVGKDLGEQISKEASAGVGDGLAKAVRSGVEDGADQGGRTLGARVARTARRAVRESVRDGLDEGTRTAAPRLRTHVHTALRDGFRRGFRFMFTGSQSQGDRMRRSLALGVAGGIVRGIAEGFDAAKDTVKAFVSNANDALKDLGKTALTGIRGALEAAAGTTATGGLNLLIGATLALAAAVPTAVTAAVTGLLALAPAVLLVGGAAGSLTTLAFGGAAALGVFALATRGLGDAFKEMSEKGKLSKETLKKLSPEAAKFVRVVGKLKKPFGELAKYVQGRLFAGLAKPVKDLAKTWLPALRPMLGDLAGRFSRLAQGIAKALGKPDFIANIRAAVAGFGGFVDRIGKGLQPFLGALGKLAKASVPFLAELGDGLGGALEKFSAWIARAEKSGALTQFMKDAAQTLRDIWDIGGLVVGIVGELIDTFFPSSKRASGTFLDGVKSGLQEVKDWLADPKNKKAIQDFMKGVGDFVKKVVTEWVPAVISFGVTVADWVDKVKEWGDKLTTFGTAVSAFCSGVAAALFALASPIAYVTGAFGLLPSGAKKNGDETTGIFRTLRATLIAVFDGMPGRMFGIGAAIGAALAAGLRSQLGEVRGVGRALANAAATAAAAGAQVINPPPGRVTKKSAGPVTRAATIRPRGGDAPSGGPLIGSLTLAPSRESARDQLEEVNFALRRIQRGGIYA
ncbi:hypothetical protein ACGFI9_20810 [Micromonospora sp. NPDC048930]|uniref:hypothetical protein n=1 Tax=Micromonospora sp. NPDC048930 TaxID=3364261 RepID=UPI003722F84C